MRPVRLWLVALVLHAHGEVQSVVGPLRCDTALLNCDDVSLRAKNHRVRGRLLGSQGHLVGKREIRLGEVSVRTTFAKADFSASRRGGLGSEQPAPDTVFFRAQTDVVAVEKRYRSEADRYRLNFTMSVQNKSDKPQSHGLIVHLYAQQDPERRAALHELRFGESGRGGMLANDKARRFSGGAPDQRAYRLGGGSAMGGGG